MNRAARGVKAKTALRTCTDFNNEVVKLRRIPLHKNNFASSYSVQKATAMR
jgi:hypothetical protein